MDNVEPGQSPITSYEQPTPQLPQEQPVGRSFHVSKKILAIIGILIVILVIGGLALFTTKKSTNTTTQTQDILLATVGDQKIYKSDIVKAADEQYTSAAITPEVLKKFYEIVIERTILNQEAARLGVNVTDAQIRNSISSNTNVISVAMQTTKRYELLKQQILQKQTKNVSAFTIGVWIASYEDPQLPIYTTQRADTIKALDDIEKDFRSNMEPTTIAKKIYDKYPSIQPRLAVNGYIFAKSQNKEAMMTPKAYTLNPEQINNPAADKYLFAALQKITPGEIVKINRPDGTGGIVVRAVSVNGDGFTTYDEFLVAKKKELVKTYASL